MHKRLGLVVAVVGVAALAVSSVGPATSDNPTGDGDHRHTVRVVSINTGEAFVDVGKKGFSIGDSFVFSSKLIRHGNTVGRAGVVCTFTSTAREEAQCVGTAKLRRGQIAIQGLLAGDPRVFSFPITGGTGSLEAAGGTVVVRELSGNRERLTFHIIH